MNIKKSALYGIIILSTATLPLSAQAATDAANEIYASPTPFPSKPPTATSSAARAP